MIFKTILPTKKKKTDSVTIKFVPENPLFSVGADGKLLCTVEHSNSVNEIAWFKNGIKIENSTKYKISGGNLTIINVAQSDGGRYSCRVSNNESHTTKSIHVKTTGSNRVFFFLCQNVMC